MGNWCYRELGIGSFGSRSFSGGRDGRKPQRRPRQVNHRDFVKSQIVQRNSLSNGGRNRKEDEISQSVRKKLMEDEVNDGGVKEHLKKLDAKRKADREREIREEMARAKSEEERKRIERREEILAKNEKSQQEKRAAEARKRAELKKKKEKKQAAARKAVKVATANLNVEEEGDLENSFDEDDWKEMQELRMKTFMARRKLAQHKKKDLVQELYVQKKAEQKVTEDWMDLHFFVIGDGATGKTCLCQALGFKEYNEEYIPTVYREDSGFIKIKGKSNVNTVKWTLHDTAGQEDVFNMTKTMLGGGLGEHATKCVIFCANVMDKTSLRNLEDWVKKVKELEGLGFSRAKKSWFIVVGTQVDRRSDPDDVDENRDMGYEEFTENEGAQMAKKLGAYAYIECSAMLYQNIREVFNVATACGASLAGKTFK
eukprot:g5293.t1